MMWNVSRRPEESWNPISFPFIKRSIWIPVFTGMTVFVVVFIHPAYAYLDPGTGVTFVLGISGFLIGLVTIAFGAVVLFFKKWLNLVKKIFARLKNRFGRP